MPDRSRQLMAMSSRERLLTTAMDLFARQGYRQTTVGEIEQEAGFTARGGTLYKHFPNKEAVLEAAIERHVERISEIGRAAVDLKLGDDEIELVLLLRSFLVELDQQRTITAILEKEGDRFSALRDRFYNGVIEPGLSDTAALVKRVIGPVGWDVEAVTVIIVGALVNHRRNEWTFGTVPLAVSDDRLIETMREFVRWARRDAEKRSLSAPSGPLRRIRKS